MWLGARSSSLFTPLPVILVCFGCVLVCFWGQDVTWVISCLCVFDGLGAYGGPLRFHISVKNDAFGGHFRRFYGHFGDICGCFRYFLGASVFLCGCGRGRGCMASPAMRSMLWDMQVETVAVKDLGHSAASVQVWGVG